jgi:hypothetical protein
VTESGFIEKMGSDLRKIVIYLSNTAGSGG